MISIIVSSESIRDKPSAVLRLSKHAHEMLARRGLSEEQVLSCLRNPEGLARVDKQDEGEYKAWFRISGRYSIVLLLSFNKGFDAYIITAYKTSKKWQKQVKKPRN